MSHYPGRPREFTPPKRRELLDHIARGATVEEAAQVVGVSLRTVQRAAKFDEHFDHELQLALHTAPVDLHQLMLRAARTHWRAAAWLLERTDPDHFAKRPPNSCRPETLQDVSAWLIETALEATGPEHREAVYRRMRTVADKAFDVLMPDQHDARRALVGALPDRPMPLSDHEYIKTLRVIKDAPDKSGSPGSPNRGGAAARGAHARPAPESESLVPPAAAQVQEPGRPESSAPPTGGIMSPKLHSATKAAATKRDAADVGRPGSPNLGGAAAGGRYARLAPESESLSSPTAAQGREPGRPDAATQVQEPGRHDGIAPHQLRDGIAGRKVA
jgi:hypothetical protein